MTPENRSLMSEALTIVRAHQAHVGASHPSRYDLVKDIGDRMDRAVKASPPEAEGEAVGLLRRIRKANIIFPSVCANNMEAYNLLDEIDKFLTSHTAPHSEGDKS